jgi:hypothetical protein
MRLASGQVGRQCVYAMNKGKTWRGYRAPIFDDTAPVYIVKGSNQRVCPKLGRPVTQFVTDKESKCSICKKKYPVGTSMCKCSRCKSFDKLADKWVVDNHCSDCSRPMDGTYRKLAGGVKITKSQAAQSEGCSVSFKSPYKFGRENVLNTCGDHVWRNEESGLLMLRSPLIRHNSWNWARDDLFYPCFQSNAWIIVKWPCQYPQLAESTGVKPVDYGVEYKGFRKGKTFASFCGLPEELEMDFTDRGASAHLPPTTQRWELKNAKTFTVERHNILKRKCSDGMPGNHLKFVKDEVQEDHKMQD